MILDFLILTMLLKFFLKVRYSDRTSEDTVFKPLVLFLSLEQNNLGYILDKFV